MTGLNYPHNYLNLAFNLAPADFRATRTNSTVSNWKRRRAFLTFARANQFYQLGCDRAQKQDKVNIAGLDRSFRHAETLRRRPALSPLS